MSGSLPGFSKKGNKYQGDTRTAILSYVSRQQLLLYCRYSYLSPSDFYSQLIQNSGCLADTIIKMMDICDFLIGK
jgi:hypothetical protein